MWIPRGCEDEHYCLLALFFAVLQLLFYLSTPSFSSLIASLQFSSLVFYSPLHATFLFFSFYFLFVFLFFSFFSSILFSRCNLSLIHNPIIENFIGGRIGFLDKQEDCVQASSVTAVWWCDQEEWVLILSTNFVQNYFTRKLSIDRKYFCECTVFNTTYGLIFYVRVSNVFYNVVCLFCKMKAL
jgi:hypothetical protein